MTEEVKKKPEVKKSSPSLAPMSFRYSGGSFSIGRLNKEGNDYDWLKTSEPKVLESPTGNCQLLSFAQIQWLITNVVTQATPKFKDQGRQCIAHVLEQACEYFGKLCILFDVNGCYAEELVKIIRLTEKGEVLLRQKYQSSNGSDMEIIIGQIILKEEDDDYYDDEEEDGSW